MSWLSFCPVGILWLWVETPSGPRPFLGILHKRKPLFLVIIYIKTLDRGLAVCYIMGVEAR